MYYFSPLHILKFSEAFSEIEEYPKAVYVCSLSFVCVKLLVELFQAEKNDDDGCFIIDSPKTTRKRSTKAQARIGIEEPSSARKTPHANVASTPSTRKTTRTASSAIAATPTPSSRKTTQATVSYLAHSSAVIAAAGAATPSTRKTAATAAPSVKTYSRSAVKKAPQAQAEKENVTQQVPVPTPVKRSTNRVKRI